MDSERLCCAENETRPLLSQLGSPKTKHIIKALTGRATEVSGSTRRCDTGNAQEMRQQLLEKRCGNEHKEHETGLGSLADQYVAITMTSSMIAGIDAGSRC